MISQPNTGLAVIVHPRESGTLLACAFNQVGVNCLLITSQDSFENHNLDNYCDVVIDPNDLQTLYKTLEQYQLQAIVPGSENGVMLADQLANHFDIKVNNEALSKARRDKSLMAIAAEQAGLAIAKQVTVASHQQLSSLLLVVKGQIL